MAMRIPTVEKCCCGFNLRLGSAIIGVLFLLGGLTQLISFSVSADNAQKNGQGDSKATFIVAAIVSACMLASCVLLLWGVHKERSSLLKPWILLYAGLSAILILVYFIGSIVAFATASVGVGVGLLFAAIICFLIYGYCLVVVYSYYLDLVGVQPGTA